MHGQHLKKDALLTVFSQDLEEPAVQRFGYDVPKSIHQLGDQHPFQYYPDGIAKAIQSVYSEPVQGHVREAN